MCSVKTRQDQGIEAALGRKEGIVGDADCKTGEVWKVDDQKRSRKTGSLWAGPPVGCLPPARWLVTSELTVLLSCLCSGFICGGDLGPCEA